MKMKTKQQEEYLKNLKRESEDLRDKINAICDDLDLDETRKDLWRLIDLLIYNNLKIERMVDK